MHKNRSKHDALLHITILVLCVSPILLSFFLSTDSKSTELHLGGLTARIGLPCIFNALTGYRCPACGMTRAFIYMSGLDFASAWGMNRAGALLYIFCLLQLPYRLLHLFKPEWNMYSLLVKLEAAFLIIIGILAILDFGLQFAD
jgi:hypothetical protein